MPPSRGLGRGDAAPRHVEYGYRPQGGQIVPPGIAGKATDHSARRRAPARSGDSHGAGCADRLERPGGSCMQDLGARALGAQARSGKLDPWQGTCPAGLSERSQGALPRPDDLGARRGETGLSAGVGAAGLDAAGLGADGVDAATGAACCCGALALEDAGGRRGHGLRVRRCRSPCRWRMLLMLRSRRATPSRT